jgi:hypothetical protein
MSFFNIHSQLHVGMINSEQWFFSLFAILDEEKIEQAAAIIWSLWNQNNEKL